MRRLGLIGCGLLAPMMLGAEAVPWNPRVSEHVLDPLNRRISSVEESEAYRQ